MKRALLVCGAVACIQISQMSSPGLAEPIAGDPRGNNDELAALFAELAAAPDARQGEAVAASIVAVWSKSGSPSIDLLMNRGLAALSANDIERAFFYFNEAVVMMPEFAEGWNKRGHVYALQKNYAGALKDFEQTLRLSPRHFTAMADMARILRALGDATGAKDLMAKGQKINPWLKEELPPSSSAVTTDDKQI